MASHTALLLRLSGSSLWLSSGRYAFSTILIVLLSGLRSEALTYSISGHYRYENQLKLTAEDLKVILAREPEAFGRAGQVPTLEELNRPLERIFRTDLDDSGRWKIKVLLQGTTDFESFVAQYDNGMLIRYTTTLSNNTDHASVSNCEVPESVTSAAEEVPWLAFASGWYFRTRTNGLALPLLSQRLSDGSNGRIEVPVEFTLSPSAPYVPMRLAYGFDERQGANPAALAKPFAARLTPAHSSELETSGFTNIGRFSLPTSFRYSCFSPASTNTSAPVCNLIVYGVVTNLSRS